MTAVSQARTDLDGRPWRASNRWRWFLASVGVVLIAERANAQTHTSTVSLHNTCDIYGCSKREPNKGLVVAGVVLSSLMMPALVFTSIGYATISPSIDCYDNGFGRVCRKSWFSDSLENMEKTLVMTALVVEGVAFLAGVILVTYGMNAVGDPSNAVRLTPRGIVF